MGNSRSCLIVVIAALSLTGCSTARNVTEAGNGTYIVTAQAATKLGGGSHAMTIAFETAKKFCSEKGGHMVEIAATIRDVTYSRDLGATGHTVFPPDVDTVATVAQENFRCESS